MDDKKRESEHFYKLVSLLLLVILLAIGFYWWKGVGYILPSFDFEPGEEQEEEMLEEKTEPVATNSGSVTAPAKRYPIEPGSKIYDHGIPVTVVYFTKDGFKPADIKIKAGEEVRFVNDTTGAMRIGVRSDLSTPFYSTFSQPGFSQKGESFQIGFSKVGIIVYESLTVQNGKLGVINIE